MRGGRWDVSRRAGCPEKNRGERELRKWIGERVLTSPAGDAPIQESAGLQPLKICPTGP